MISCVLEDFQSGSLGFTKFEYSQYFGLTTLELGTLIPSDLEGDI